MQTRILWSVGAGILAASAFNAGPAEATTIAVASASYSYNDDTSSAGGYNSPGKFGMKQFNYIDALFAGAADMATTTLTATGQSATRQVGTAQLLEHYIAGTYMGYTGQYDPASMAPLAVQAKVTLSVDGTSVPLSFVATPSVKGGPPFTYYAGTSNYPLGVPGSVTKAQACTTYVAAFVGCTANNSAPDFKLDFTPQSITVNGTNLSVSLSSIIFTTGDLSNSATPTLADAASTMQSVTITLGASTTPVPEPGTAALVLSGLAGAVWLRRRGTRAA